MQGTASNHVAVSAKATCIGLFVIVVVILAQSSFLSWQNPLLSLNILAGFMIFVLVIINVTIVVEVVSFVVIFILRRFKNYTRKPLEQEIAEGMPCPEITVIIPCFLPNEQDIIEGTIEHVINKLQSPGAMKLMLVYNTPKDMPEVEGRLREMEKRTDYKDGRRLEVLRVHTSTSKAENLNYAVSKTSSEYIAIYDADHHPDPGSLVRLYREMWEQGADSVMGSLYIRSLDSLMARWIDVDFFFVHFMIFSGLGLWTRVGFFGGSNAIVRKDLLVSYPFNLAVQCEDIDLSARCLLDNKKMVFCPEARCGELAPANLRAFYKQRLRWFMGWDQASFRYLGGALRRSSRPCFYKATFFFFFTFRWYAPAIGASNLFVNIWIRIFKPDPFLDQNFKEMMDNVQATPLIKYTGSLAFVLQMFLGLIEAICQASKPGFQRSVGQSMLQLLSIVAYQSILVPYMAVWFFLEVHAMFKIFTKSTGGWVVTVRAPTKNQSLHLSSPLLSK